VIEEGFWQRLWRWLQVGRSRLTLFSDFDVEILDQQFEKFRDPFDLRICSELVLRAAEQGDHASRLAMLWAALRQLCTVPYTEAQPAEIVSLWEKCLIEWKRSGGWYGMHDGSPFSLLAAINSLDSLRAGADRKTAIYHRENPQQREYAGRASALYSMSKRPLLPWHRRQLLIRALAQVNRSLQNSSTDPSDNLLVRGSIYCKLWQFGNAIHDHESAVQMRRLHEANDSQLGEALTELGWTYARALRFGAARRVFAEGIERLQSLDAENKQDDGFVVRGLFKYGMFMAVILRFPTAVEAIRKACRLANERVARDQMRGVRRFLCWAINRAP
jgi:tetratricopeptide (TPR) repeat protein